MTSTAQSTPALRPNWLTVVLWLLQILAAAAFIAAGFAKLSGVPMMVDIFTHIGIGQWFRYFTGAVEVGSGAALLIPALAPFGAVMLMVTMVTAVAVHLLVIGGSPVPAIILLGVVSVVAWLRRAQLQRAFGRNG